MEELLQLLHHFKSFAGSFFESAGFYFVPIFACIGLLNLRVLNRRKGTAVFLIVTAVMMLFYIVFARRTGRYLLIPLLFFGCLAGTGIDWAERQLNCQTYSYSRICYPIS